MDLKRLTYQLRSIFISEIVNLNNFNVLEDLGIPISDYFDREEVSKGLVNSDNFFTMLPEMLEPKEDRCSGSYLHFKDIRNKLGLTEYVNGGSENKAVWDTSSGIHNGVLKMNQQNTEVKTTYQIKGDELVVQLDGEEITLTEEKVRGFIEREKEIMKRIATGNYLERF